MPTQGGRRRLLMVAAGCHPTASMEWRIGWRRALLAAEVHDVTVLHGPGMESEELAAAARAQRGRDEGLRFVRVERGALGDCFNACEATFYLGYRQWNRRAYEVGKRLHDERPFDLVHQVNYCGYREPGFLWKLGVPFVWGPVGGTQNLPLRFLGCVDPLSAARELSRGAMNAWQLRHSRPVRRAAKGSAFMMAATTTAERDIRRALGVETVRQLETGLDCQVAPPRPPRPTSEPLHILWAGRLRAWKALPLLLRAAAQLPPSVPFALRVLGSGPCRGRWRRMAERLGISDRVEWVEWPGYAETLPHYRWADAFAFTSLRDTSGTGLLESLAAGTPIVGLDHQGAADIMTADCSLPIPVTTPRSTIKAFTDALAELAADADHWSRLSEGARRRASGFAWDDRLAFTQRVYDQALNHALPSAASLFASPGAEPASEPGIGTPRGERRGRQPRRDGSHLTPAV
ncbi:MAG: glycosyltransferase [Planctomycetota bacterium]